MLIRLLMDSQGRNAETAKCGLSGRHEGILTIIRGRGEREREREGEYNQKRNIERKKSISDGKMKDCGKGV